MCHKSNEVRKVNAICFCYLRYYIVALVWKSSRNACERKFGHESRNDTTPLLRNINFNNRTLVQQNSQRNEQNVKPTVSRPEYTTSSRNMLLLSEKSINRSSSGQLFSNSAGNEHNNIINM
jgi:hypothetical protein